MIRGLIFDCFGVLHLEVNVAYFSRFPEHRVELHDLNKRADHGLIDRPAYLEEAGRILGLPPREVLDGIAREHTLNQPLVEYITRQLRGRYKIGMLSNVGRGWMEEFFTANQLHDLFNAVVLSGEIGAAKPEPLAYQRIAEQLGLAPEECVMIDDRAENCRGAEAVGMKSLLFTDNGSLYPALEVMLGEDLPNA